MLQKKCHRFLVVDRRRFVGAEVAAGAISELGRRAAEAITEFGEEERGIGEAALTDDFGDRGVGGPDLIECAIEPEVDDVVLEAQTDIGPEIA